MSKRTIGCLGLAGVLVAGVYFLLQTEVGKWFGGLLVVYGGAIVGMAMLYEQQTAVVVDVKPRDHPMLNGMIAVEYTDNLGERRTVRKNALGRPGQLDNIEVGETISIIVCKANPLSIKIPSLQAPGGEPCVDPAKQAPRTAATGPRTTVQSDSSTAARTGAEDYEADVDPDAEPEADDWGSQ